ncbi:phage antirepressor KilAC domain-containing protein [Gordonia sp. PP30]|uniref:phage antirepressor KilAC domain-containing protein n=1 Tax=Gordonia sp. PP30 TaxID=2935861 RepID=UPI001FFEA356|nr:phage antirepressor KilAC domain-containing protein [Gordonia sp. PP30]UQE73873.1 phage antirepressor KilAC domain-containing protein [Gordonia sp. PP30]
MHDTNQLAFSGTSPFDAIMQTRPDGSKFWPARSLMPLMGYDKWQNFKAVTERAKKAAENVGVDIAAEFSQVTQVIEAGNLGMTERVDFELSRFAAYLVAMNGDPNKPEVAAAQGYFAIRTRQAETARPQLTDDEVIHQALVITTGRVTALAQLAGRLATEVAAQAPKAEAYDAFMDATGSHKLAAVAKMLGWGPVIMNRELRKLGVLRRDNLPMARYAHHFNVVPQTYTRPDGQVVPTATTYVLPSGVEFLRRKLAGIEVPEQPVTVAALPVAEPQMIGGGR